MMSVITASGIAIAATNATVATTVAVIVAATTVPCIQRVFIVPQSTTVTATRSAITQVKRVNYGPQAHRHILTGL